MIERCRMFSLRGKMLQMTWWIPEGLSFSGGAGVILCSLSKWSQGQCKGDAEREDSEKSGASKFRMDHLRRSLTRAVQALLFVLLWKISKHHMSGWTRGPFPTKSLWNGERSWTERESRDEHVPGVYYCLKWNHSCLGNSTKSLIFTGGYF